jgi:hypothetical protein
VGWTLVSSYVLGLRVFPCRTQSTIQASDLWCTPVHLDGTLTGAKPRLRHNPDCGHFEWGDVTILGTPQLATEEQMQTLRACQTCVETRGGPSRDARHDVKDGRTGEFCPTCNQMTPLTGICDNCSS